MNHIVVGLGFGDEGKGLTTDYLALQNPDSLVVRFNGGHQAGHTVMTKDGKRHVFSNFGSGTLRGLPTYWSRFCTSHPLGMLQERKALVALGQNPILYVDALSPVTTPWDIAYNKAIERVNNHGSVGVGFGTTLQREEDNYHLYVQDLPYAPIRNEKLDNIRYYYSRKVAQLPEEASNIYHASIINANKEFWESTEEYLTHIKIVQERAFLGYQHEHEHVIFEGAQGTLLDMDFGFFPYVTRSNTTCKNALELIRSNRMGIAKVTYVTRAYQTRHGNGWMSNMDKIHMLKLKDTEGETNVYNKWQGNFKRTLLDLDLLAYAIKCNRTFHPSREDVVITCINQIDGDHLVTKQGNVISLSEEHDQSDIIYESLDIEKFTVSDSPYAEDILVNA